MTVPRSKSLIGRNFVITGCLTVDPLETTDKLPKSPRLVGYPKQISDIKEGGMDQYKDIAISRERRLRLFVA